MSKIRIVYDRVRSEEKMLEEKAIVAKVAALRVENAWLKEDVQVRYGEIVIVPVGGSLLATDHRQRARF